jgi:hypothetical protein
MKVLSVAKPLALGCVLLAGPALALDPIFKGTWTVVSPHTQEMHGVRLRFSNRTRNSVYVQINQMSGQLRESDGRGDSNHVVRTEAFDCYYDVVIVTGRKRMTWRLVLSRGANCVQTFTAELDP